MSTTQDSQVNASPVDRGASVYGATWSMTAVMIAIVLLQVAFKFARHRSLQLHDWLIIAAMVVGLAQSIAVTKQVAGGLGQHKTAIFPDKLAQFEKAAYASQMLYVGALGLSKVSSAHASSRMSPVSKFIFVGRGIMVASALWAATAFVMAALQCSLSWQILSGSCLNQTQFWTGVGSFDLILDVTLFNLPSHIVSTIEGLPWSRKAPIMMTFGSKLIVVPLTIVRLVFLSRVQHANDPTWDTMGLVIVTQVQLNFAIFTTCLPYLRMVASRFEDGVFTTDGRLAPRNARNASKSKNHAPLTIRIPDRRHLDPTANPARHLSVRGSAAQSPGVSSLGSSKMIINKLTTFWVEEEPAARNTPPPMPQPVSTIRESFFES